MNVIMKSFFCWARNENGTTKAPKCIRVIMISLIYGVFFILSVFSGFKLMEIEKYWAGIFVFVITLLILLLWIKDLYIIIKTDKKSRSVPLWMEVSFQIILSSALLYLTGCLSLVCFLSKEYVFGVISLILPALALFILIYGLYRLQRIIKDKSRETRISRRSKGSKRSKKYKGSKR